MEEKIVTGIYIRVSTEDQAKDDFSIHAQREKLTKYAEANDWDIFDYYVDDGISSKNLKEIRTKNKHTQENVANIINVDQSNYSKCELGKMYIHTYALIEFAKHYKVSIDWLCGKTKDSEIK